MIDLTRVPTNDKIKKNYQKQLVLILIINSLFWAFDWY
jgi:hypothetical protein